MMREHIHVCQPITRLSTYCKTYSPPPRSIVGGSFIHFERNVKDPKTGNITSKEWTALIKGRLLQVTHVKVDGVAIYSAAGNTDAEPENDSDDHGDARDAEYIPE